MNSRRRITVALSILLMSELVACGDTGVPQRYKRWPFPFDIDCDESADCAMLAVCNDNVLQELYGYSYGATCQYHPVFDRDVCFYGVPCSRDTDCEVVCEEGECIEEYENPVGNAGLGGFCGSTADAPNRGMCHCRDAKVVEALR